MRLLNRYRSWWTSDYSWTALVHLTIVAALYVIWNFVIKIDNCYFFYEYILKFVPFLLEARPIDWFNTWELGDPRPRLIMVLVEVANLYLRGWVSHLTTLPPALGINWLIYPLVCATLYRTVFLLSEKRFVALSVALMWGLSPAALDSLVACYVPAKTLMNLWFALVLLAGAHLQLALPRSPVQPAGARGMGRAAVFMALVIFLAFLTDETAAIILLCVPIIFYRNFLSNRAGWKPVVLAWSALVIPLGLFCVVALWVYPAINRGAGQVPLDFVQMALKGPVVAYKGSPAGNNISSTHLASWAANFQPGGTALTMITAHLLPFRRVLTFWTSGSALTVGSWPRNEIGFVILFFGAYLATAISLPATRRRFIWALAVAAACLVVGYAVLLVPLGPAIVEVNYYGSLSSMVYALAIGFTFADLGSRQWQRGLALGAIILFGSLQAMGYAQTAKRNRTVFSNNVDFSATAREIPWDYRVLREISDSVVAGKFTETALRHPYPSRAFCYAFELEARRQLGQGNKIDFVPTEAAESLYGMLLQAHLVSLKGMVPPVVSMEPKLTLRLANGARAVSREELAELLSHKAWHGAGDEYSFTRSYSDGKFVEIYWIPFVMRVWRQHGNVRILEDGRLRADGVRSGAQELRVVQDKGSYFAYNEEGRCLFRFQVIPPLDL